MNQKEEFIFQLYDNIYLKNNIYIKCIDILSMKKIISNENLKLNNDNYIFLSNCYLNYINNYKLKINDCDKYINSTNSNEYNKCLKNTYDEFIKIIYSKNK